MHKPLARTSNALLGSEESEFSQYEYDTISLFCSKFCCNTCAFPAWCSPLCVGVPPLGFHKYPFFISVRSIKWQGFQKAIEMAVDVGGNSRAHTIVTACIVIPIITLIFILLRMWSRLFLVHAGVGLDDCEWQRLIVKCQLTSVDTAIIVLVRHSGPLPTFEVREH